MRRTLFVTLFSVVGMSCAQERAAPDHSGAAVALAESPPGVSELVTPRKAIDRAGETADCEATQNAYPRSNWLHAWCGLRSGDWEWAVTHSEEAVIRFEEIGAIRRQVEMHLISALARVRLGSSHAESVRRAEQLMGLSRMPLHGELYDRFGGDLPYLVARARAAGIDVEPARRRSMKGVLEAASIEYRTADVGEAVPHVARLEARHAVADHRFADAAQALKEAIGVDRRAGNRAGLRASFEVGRELAAALGDWTMVAVLDDRAGVVLEPTVLPSAGVRAGDSVEAMIRTRTGRRTLAERLESVRLSSTASVQRPRVLEDVLADDALLDRLELADFRLAHEAGLLLRDRGAHVRSRDYLEFAVAGVEKARASISDRAARHRFLTRERDIYLALVDGWVGIDTARRAPSHYERALEVANGLKARGLLDLLAGARPPTRRSGRSQRDRDTELRLADRLVARLDTWSHPPPPSASPKPLGMLGRLGDDTAIVEYVVAPRRSYVWVIHGDELHARQLAGRETIAPLVDAFLDTLETPRADRERHRELAERLYVELLGPVQDLIADHDRLIFAPDGVLYDLPFEALARPARDDDTLDYVVRSHAVAYAPSTAVLAALDGREQSEGTGYLLVGDPTFDRPALQLLAHTEDLAQSGMFDLDRLFPRLPGTAAEVQRIGGLVVGSARTLTGKDASEAAVWDALQARPRVLHIATHGVTDAPSDHPVRFRQPAMLLTRGADSPRDGVLTLDEVLAAGAGPELVVLSGCSTGRGWRTLGAGAFGLAGAFIYAGSRSVIASRWEVGDRYTTRLMVSLYSALADDFDPAGALRSAQLVMIDAGRPPYAWAGFRTVAAR